MSTSVPITEAAPATITTEDISETSALSPLPAITISPSVSMTEAALATIAAEVEVFETPAPPLNLWKEAFENVNDETKRWIQEHGLNSTEQLQPDGPIKELITLLKSKTLAEDNDTPSKIVIGDRRIVLREHVNEVVSLLTMAGDIAMNFAPPQASAPWAVGKALLKIPVKHIDQKLALTGTIRWFTRIVHRGQVYELRYTAINTDEQIVSNLHDALRDLYIAAIELLARSDVVFRSGRMKQAFRAIVQPDEATNLVSELLKKEEKVVLEAQACEVWCSARTDAKLFQRTQYMLEKLDEMSAPLRRADEGLIKLFRQMDETQLDELMDFISSEGYGKNHSELSESRVEGTGDWLISHQCFRQWQASRHRSVLYLKGNVGTGKTFLTSRVIDHLKDTLHASLQDEGFAFFYCNRSTPLMRDPLVVLRSFVRQLADRNDYDDVPKSLVQAYEKAKKEKRGLSYKECETLILDLLGLYARTTIVLDALDESDTEKYIIADTLVELIRKAKDPVRLFVSSRPDREYLKAFDGMRIITLNSDDQQIDIGRYLNAKLYSTPSFQSRPTEIQKLIRGVFTSRNCGMFRWVHLQVKQVNPLVSNDAIELWAKTVPGDLMEAYDQMWNNLKKDHGYDMPLIERAIKWVLGYLRPLGTGQLVTAIRYTIEGDTLVEKERQTPRRILSLCQGFLTLDAEKQAWMLPHASVADYFESRSEILGNCHAFVANIQLKILMEPEEDVLVLESHKDDPDDPEFCSDYIPFRHAFMNSWPTQVQQYDRWLGATEGATPDAQLAASLRRFLGSPEQRSTYYIKWFKNRLPGYDMLDSSDVCWLAMCRYGLYYVLQDWWENYVSNRPVDLCNLRYKGLALAVQGGCMEVCRCLLSTMDELDSVQLGPAIRTAIDEGHKDFFSLLMERGNFSIATYFEEKPYELLKVTRHPGLIEWFARHCLFDPVSGNSLLEAARRGDLQAAKDLIEMGADVNHRPKYASRYGSPLAAAVASDGGSFGPDRVELILLLLENRADPNLPLYSGQSGTALESTIFFYYEPPSPEEMAENELAYPMQVLAILLRAGAKPAMVLDHGNHGSALAAAAYRGLKDMLELMVEIIGKDSAIECLRQSRRPERTGALRFRSLRQSREATIAYLTDELGVDKETLHKIGLWQVSPEEVGTFEDTYFKYRPSQESRIQEPEIQESRIQDPNAGTFSQLLYIFAAVAVVAVVAVVAFVALSYGIFDPRSWGYLSSPITPTPLAHDTSRNQYTSVVDTGIMAPQDVTPSDL
ncbi:hypothetical protein THARTR1_08383 [Trichoderma harzianum]|uniref:Nephrocystin 3-like N-terminal domain-containing protein n=1 Tax=Trichoderma harzianum TaxID=5544 RepID=A0A2K0TYZ1_TRIHA|nr:hypothetical protein THARTR1_08383 [Trichoderma harzianum]